MFTHRIELFKLFGIPLRIDVSWLLIFVLISWSLATGLFPAMLSQSFPERAQAVSRSAYWLMGVAGALGLFVSVVLHELAHALVARRWGVPMRGITLFIFGGVAEMGGEPPSAKSEFYVAIAGPIASVAIALVCFAATAGLSAAGAPLTIWGVVGYLATINGLLVAFNMIPAFPLDGGRVLRSALWHWRGDLRRATRIASTIGSGFGLALVLLGVVSFLSGAFVSGMWWVLIGFFLRNAAQMSYQQVLIRRVLEGEPVYRFMSSEPQTVPPTLTLDRLVDDYIYRTHHKMFPVTDGDRLLGCVSTRQLKAVPRERWNTLTVGDVVEPCSPDNTVRVNEDAMAALSRMHRTDASRLLVVDEQRLVGVLTLKDLTKFIALKIELEENGAPLRRFVPRPETV